MVTFHIQGHVYEKTSCQTARSFLKGMCINNEGQRANLVTDCQSVKIQFFGVCRGQFSNQTINSGVH